MNQTVKVIAVKLVLNPKVILNNREWKKIRQYMRNNYQVCDRLEGKIVLEKKPEIVITLMSDEGEVKEVGFSNRVAEFYGNELHMDQLFKQFNNDLESNNVNVQKGKNGYYVSVPASKEKI